MILSKDIVCQNLMFLAPVRGTLNENLIVKFEWKTKSIR